MYKKFITGTLLCGIALSSASSLLINATNGMGEGEVAIAFDVNISESQEFEDVLVNEDAPEALVDMAAQPQVSSTTDLSSVDNNESLETVESVEEATLADTNVDEPVEETTDKNNSEVSIEDDVTEPQPETEKETEAEVETETETETEKETDKEPEKPTETEPTTSETNPENTETKPETNYDGNLSIVEDNGSSNYETPSTPNYSTPTTQTQRSWNLAAPNAQPNQNKTNQNNAVRSVPGSMLNYQVTVTDTYHPLDPTSWKQNNAPYSNEYFAYSGTSFGDASCGIHTLANVFLKTGYAIEGFNAVDAYNWALKNGFGENNNGMPAYAWGTLEEKTGGYIKNAGYFDESEGTDGAEWVRQEYAKGNFVVMGTNMNGVPHIIMLDYVDDKGNVVTLDSGGGYQFLSQQDSGHVRYAFSFKIEGIPAQNSPKLWAGEKLSSFKPIRDAKYKHFAQNKNNSLYASNN